MVFRKFAASVLCATLALPSGVFAADRKHKDDKKKKNSVILQMDERQRAVHAVNRLTFGPRPGDVDRVLAIGVDRWIDQQLNPKRVDDAALESRLAPLRSVRMNTRELVENFPPPQIVKAIAAGRMELPRDPQKRAVYEAAIERYDDKKARKNDKAAQRADLLQMDQNEMSDDQKERRRQARDEARSKALDLLEQPVNDRIKAIMAMDRDQRRMFYAALSQSDREQLVADMTPQQKETLLALENPVAVVNGELMAAKLIRATYSERQLEEVMTDFWFNHFNVFIGKGPDRYLVTTYERDVIRPHALGKFKDLLMATAKSPAMLWYLDNWQSVGPNSEAGLGLGQRARYNRPFARPRPNFGPFGGPRVGIGARLPLAQDEQAATPQPKKAPRGLNENYAREVMELHTLGVNGGYTQKDVTELARVLTGWTISEPRRGGGYDFNPRTHEPGEKVVLGHKFKNDGEKEGEQALEMLAHHPSTARFISTKLATRFVSDNPPQSLIDKMAETFTKSDGDIKEVLRTMFKATEFWSPDAYRAKVKTPLEFVVSSLRATGADFQNPRVLIDQLNRMGMPLYGMQPPTGYSMKAETWVNSSALLARMNFALAIGAGRLPGIKVDTTAALGPNAPIDADGVQALLESSMLNGDVSRQTHETIKTQLTDPQVTGRKLDDAPKPVNASTLAGLILGSPEFQRR